MYINATSNIHIRAIRVFIIVLFSASIAGISTNIVDGILLISLALSSGIVCNTELLSKI